MTKAFTVSAQSYKNENEMKLKQSSEQVSKLTISKLNTLLRRESNNDNKTKIDEEIELISHTIYLCTDYVSRVNEI